MNKYQEAIKEVRDSAEVGGVLADPTQTILTLEELYEEYKRAKAKLCTICGKWKAGAEGNCNKCRWK